MQKPRNAQHMQFAQQKAQQQANQRLALAAQDQPNLTCSKCNSQFFTQATRIKVVPAIAIGAGDDVIWQEHIYVCNDCHTPLEIRRPKSD